MSASFAAPAQQLPVVDAKVKEKLVRRDRTRAGLFLCATSLSALEGSRPSCGVKEEVSPLSGLQTL